jgi:cytoplasmic tRNA 2-thiolation protein 2
LQVSLTPSVLFPFSKFHYRPCFFSLIQTRFKKSLEPFVNPQPDGPRRKALEAAGSLVIGFSAGTCSTTLLDLVAKTYFAPRPPATEFVKGGKAHPRNAERRVWKGKPAVCYVELCGAFPDVRPA